MGWSTISDRVRVASSKPCVKNVESRDLKRAIQHRDPNNSDASAFSIMYVAPTPSLINVPWR